MGLPGVLRPHMGRSALLGPIRTWVVCEPCRRQFSNVDAALLHAEKVHPAEVRVPEPHEFA